VSRFRVGVAVLFFLFLAVPAFPDEFSNVTVTNLQAVVSGAWHGEPAHRVNDRGEIIGGGNEAKYWSAELKGEVIPTLGGVRNSASSLSQSGEVAGNSQIAGYGDTDAPTQLYKWTPADGMRPIGAFPGGRYIGASKVNAGGDIIGWADYPGHGYMGYGDVAFLWTEAGGFQELAPPVDGVDISPADINERGQIVGAYSRGTNAYDLTGHAFLREPNGEFLMLGFPGEAWSGATHINNQGQVAGIFNPDGAAENVHAFVWSVTTGMVDAGRLAEGQYLQVNDFSEKGHMVGDSWGGAWFWSPETGMVSVPTLGGSYNAAWALNDFDQVVGWL
jgi:probable HAF family extracellular repeat protein